jgi:hypothetical protein
MTGHPAVVDPEPAIKQTALPLPSALKQIGLDAGAAVARDTLARIHSGEISKYDVDATTAKLASFVFDCCDDLRTDGHGEMDVILFRDSCVHGFRVAWSAFRAGCAAASVTPQEKLQ